ncbi:hypothetical protein C9I92_17280 [Photobacterium ganghwense]|nr:hypothetical protein C9I92_17280 [Photobacterium ganghwense]
MIKVNFHLLADNKSWSAELNQLNSDILQRHIHPFIAISAYLLNFEYCEQTQSGSILSEKGLKVGIFTVS